MESEVPETEEQDYKIKIDSKLEQTNTIAVESQQCVILADTSPKTGMRNEQSLQKSKESTSQRTENQNEAKLDKFQSDYELHFTRDSNQLKIKQELGYNWKQCLLCDGRSDDIFDIFTEMTSFGHVTLVSYISKIANVSLENHCIENKFACRTCYSLINVIEQAELEYIKHRGFFLEIIKNSNFTYDVLLDNECQNVIKIEPCKAENDSSDDNEPLSTIKPSNKKKNKIKTNGAECSPEDKRHFSSDEDFCWTLDIKEDVDVKESKIKIKKKKKRRRKKVKIEEEITENYASHLLEVELKEEVVDKPLVSEPKRHRGRPSNNMFKEKNITSKKNQDKCDLICVKCDKSFSRKEDYDYHMVKHENLPLPFICEVCGKGFKNRKMCDVHVLMHKGIADYKCIPCNKLFPTKFAFLRHDKIHKGTPKHQCEQCGKSFIHTSSFRMHKLAHAGIKKHACDICGLALISSSHLRRHKRIHSGEKRFECDSCGKKFSEKYNMQSHMKTHLKGKDLFALESIMAETPSPPNDGCRRKRFFKCERCDEKFDRLFKLEIHLVDDHKVVLKKGRPKPRNTMKKLQRAQQAAANMVNAIANAIGAKRAAKMAAIAEGIDVKPSVSSLDEKMKEHPTSIKELKKSPEHSSISPGASYMSPTQTNAGGNSREYHDQPQVIRTASTMWPHMAYNMPMGYLSRMPDYTQHN